jgi:hypothetical protein
LVLLLFHLLEIAVWALFFWWEKCLPNMSNRLMNEFNALERKAGVLTIQGMQQTTIHTGMFMQALAAREAGNDKLANFYVERFPPELRKAYDAWLAQKPFENPNADPHPFVPRLYETRGTRSRGSNRKGF